MAQQACCTCVCRSTQPVNCKHKLPSTGIASESENPKRLPLSISLLPDCSGHHVNHIACLQHNLWPFTARLQPQADSAHLSGAQPQQHAPSIQPAQHAEQTFGPQQIAELYRNTLKLASENKITKDNTWALGLIDHMSDLVKPSHHDRGQTNFQRASCTLDAGVKIYSYRVDSVHNSIYKTLGGLSRTAASDQQEQHSVGKLCCLELRRLCTRQTVGVMQLPALHLQIDDWH